ncbi:glycosyltransferase [Paenibacillus agilis]|uniref:Glycosyltransferase family 2 protein n=1 Tax=Paenibacillus agilis TaxID=3020863 RepID=A0A559IPG7_9BACL|nr:glycosyltransferase family 2 protein [Paenibacillus agilis]TVX89443.1 glycosyltransferase family 2 protein [Paenibacillus agilis]
MLPISVCMIVKNEEKHIRQAIESVKPYVKEVIVLDTGSTDNTGCIAANSGARVYGMTWNNSFADMRNACISYANQPYILVLDADERLSLCDMEIMEQALRIMEQGKGYAGDVVIRSSTQSGEISESTITRLFPNRPDYKYQGRIHEQLVYKQETIKSIRTGIVIDHFGYEDEEIQSKDKYRRNLALIQASLEANENDSYLLFQLGRTYYVMKEYQSAAVALTKCIDSMASTKQHYLSTTYLTLGYTYIHLKEWGLFEKCLNDAIDIYPDYTDLYYMYGTALVEAKNPEWLPYIPDAFMNCLQLGAPTSSKYETVAGVGTYKAHYNLGVYYELTGNIELALYHYEQGNSYNYELANQSVIRLKQLIKG